MVMMMIHRNDLRMGPALLRGIDLFRLFCSGCRDDLRMGPARWSLNNSKKPRGQLDRTKHFLAATDSHDVPCRPGTDFPHLFACHVGMPENSCIPNMITATENLAGAQTRSLELWWNAEQKTMDVILVAAGRRDLEAYKREFLHMYPRASFVAMDGNPVPTWFDSHDPCMVFDVGTFHGHYAATFDKDPSSSLISADAHDLQSSQNAWLQLVFRRYPFDGFLSKHLECVRAKTREIQKYDMGKKPAIHPESGYDFDDNSYGLLMHPLDKKQHPLVMMSIRGLVKKADHKFDPKFEHIRSTPIEYRTSKYERLTKFTYRNFWNPSSPKHVNLVGRNIQCPRIAIFEHRLLPDPQEFLDSALERYFQKSIFGRYRDRNPLPFLILNTYEMPGFVRLPDPHFIPDIGFVMGEIDVRMRSGHDSPWGDSAYPAFMKKDWLFSGRK